MKIALVLILTIVLLIISTTDFSQKPYCFFWENCNILRLQQKVYKAERKVSQAQKDLDTVREFQLRLNKTMYK